MNEKGYTLYIVEGDLVRKYHTEEFQKREITIGSGGADILVESNTISKIHLRINLRNDKLYFADNDSREGSFMYNNTAFSKLASMKYYKKEGQDTVLRLGDAVLVIVADNKGESEYLKANIEKGVTIGRSRESSIVLNHFGISRRHAEILPAEKGNIDMLYVYGNKRTFVNGREVEHEQVLRNCDYIQILHFTMIYFNSFLIYKKVFDGANMELHHIVKKNAWGKKVLDDVSFRIDGNEFAAIVGGTNAGKNALLNVMKGSEHHLKTGEVYLNGLDLPGNIDMLREAVGYVPKESVLHDQLTLKTCMTYAMKLKSYDDVQDKELDRRIDSVLDTLQIISYADTTVEELPKDVRKRADIAMELLGNPSILMLDEPFAGLDDEEARGLLYMLRDIARMFAKTMVIVMDKPRRLELFDKILFMGAGGKICFCGTLDEAKMFFDTESVTEIQHLLKEQADNWSEEYRNYFSFSAQPRERVRSKLKPKMNRKKQFLTLLQRHFELLFKGSVMRLILLLLQPLFFGGLMYIVPKAYTVIAMLAAAAWMGALNAISAICEERVIVRRECCAGALKPPLYLLTKYVLQVLFAVVQSAEMTAVIWFATGFSGQKSLLLPDPFADTLVMLLLVILASASWGLWVSAVLKRTTLLPLAVMVLWAAESAILWAAVQLFLSWLGVTAIAAVIAGFLLTLAALQSLSKSEE